MGFYGSLYISETESLIVNASVNSLSETVHIYVRCAELLGLSLAAQGIGFTLLTNQPDAVSALISRPSSIDVEEIPYPSLVPAGTRFYAAHKHLDVFKFIATAEVDYAVLVDLDVLCLNEVPFSLANASENGIPMAYEITDHKVPAYGQEKIASDLRMISEQDSEGRWFGGEFSSGPPWFFSKVASEVEKVVPRYFLSIDQLHHVGWEALYSAALQRLRDQGVSIEDAGVAGVIGRFWNWQTRHKPISWTEESSKFLVHLPSDKKFLSRFSQGRTFFSSRHFLRVYFWRRLFRLPLSGFVIIGRDFRERSRKSR